MKAIKLKTRNTRWRKLGLDVLRNFTGFTTEPLKDITKEIVDIAKKMGWGRGEGFQDLDPSLTPEE